MNSLLVLRWWVKQNKKLQTLELFISDFGLQKAHFVCNPLQQSQVTAEGESQAPDTSSVMNEEFWSRAGSDLPKDYLRFMSSHIPITLWRPWQEQFLPHCWQVLINLDLESDESDKHSVTGSSISHSYFILWTGLVSEVSAASFTQKQRRYCPVLDTWGGSQTVCSHSCHNDSCYGDIYWKLKAPGQSQISIFRLIQST